MKGITITDPKREPKYGVKCLRCGDELYSRHRHDFVRCSCGCVYIDGGDDYCRIGGDAADIEIIKEQV